MTLLTAELGRSHWIRPRHSQEQPRATKYSHRRAEVADAQRRRRFARSIPASTPSPSKPLFANIDKLTTDNAHGEYYLTDMAPCWAKPKKRVVAVEANNADEILGGNTRAELMELDAQMRAAKCRN